MNSGQGQAGIFGLMLSFVSRFPNASGGVAWSALGGESISTTTAV